MGKKEEYEICKVRGHEPTGTTYGYGTPGSLDWNECKYCGTHYAAKVTSELIEKNTPDEDSNNE